MPRGITTDTIGRAGCGLALDFDLTVALILTGLGGRESFAFWAGAFFDFTPNLDCTATEDSFERYIPQACAFPRPPHLAQALQPET
jgi:hypothetical protein